jgi:hypothetical protein
MAAILDALQIGISIYARIKNALKLSSTLDTIQKNVSYSFTDGAGANQADVHWSDERIIAASGAEDLDLAGALTDAFGAVISFVRIKAIYIEADAANTNNVLLGGAAANAFINWVADATDRLSIRPGGAFLLVASDAVAYAVTAGTGDLLRVGNSGAGTSVKYRIILIGSLA